MLRARTLSSSSPGSGARPGLVSSIGPGKLFDTHRWFVITIDALGDGVSSSPSNSMLQPGPSFPEFTIGDMVRSQHRLLTEILGLGRVHAVAGLSMGGMQALQWAVSFPGFARKIVAITGTPRQTAHDLIVWKTQLNLLKSFSDSPLDLEKAMRTAANVQLLQLRTPEWIVRSFRPEEVDERLEKHQVSLMRLDPFDYMAQLRAMIGQDIGPFDEAARTLRAELLIVVALQDEMVHPDPARELARVAKAHLVTLSGDCGHLAPGCESAIVQREVSRFLTEAPPD